MPKILLVEDDPYIYRLYQKLFLLESFEIELAQDGAQGLAKLQHFHPDIILLDIMMGTMNGIEMLTSLKSDPATANIPVIVLTNMSDMGTTQMALDKGALQTIIKSEKDPAEIVALVKDAIKYAERPPTEAA